MGFLVISLKSKVFDVFLMLVTLEPEPNDPGLLFNEVPYLRFLVHTLLLSLLMRSFDGQMFFGSFEKLNNKVLKIKQNISPNAKY